MRSSSVVAPSLSERPDLFEDAWYTDSNVPDDGFKERFEQRYPGMVFRDDTTPYAYDSLKMLVQVFEHQRNPPSTSASSPPTRAPPTASPSSRAAATSNRSRRYGSSRAASSVVAPIVKGRSMRCSIGMFSGVLIAAAPLGAYGIAAKNGPQGDVQEPAAGLLLDQPPSKQGPPVMAATETTLDGAL